MLSNASNRMKEIANVCNWTYPLHLLLVWLKDLHKTVTEQSYNRLHYIELISIYSNQIAFYFDALGNHFESVCRITCLNFSGLVSNYNFRACFVFLQIIFETSKIKTVQVWEVLITYSRVKAYIESQIRLSKVVCLGYNITKTLSNRISVKHMFKSRAVK